MALVVRAGLIAALCLATASCGGGGSPPPPPPGSPNNPPAFTSPATLTVQENFSGIALIPTASDPEGQPVTYGALGGPDAARFLLNVATREIRFAAAPNFEAPADAGANNVYDISITASDGVNSITQTISVTITNVLDGFRVRRIASGLSSPIFVTGLPDGSGRILVVERAGRIRVLNPTTGAFNAADFLNITGVDTSGEKGLLAIAFSNTYAADRTFYVHMNPNTANTTEIRQYRSPTATDVADPASANAILVVPQPATSNHKGGFLALDPMNRLLIGLGDGGGGGDPLGAGQNTSTLLGKILRIDPRTDAFPTDDARDYAIPPPNAFSGGGGAPEIFIHGVRNPFRGSLDLPSNSIFIGDVGQDAIEEIDRIPITAGGSINLGWNLREGTLPFNGGANSPSFIPPVAEYGHGPGPDQGNSITGGVVYRGPIEDLQGLFIFADFIRSNIWTVPAASLLVDPPITTPSSAFTNRNAAFAPDVGAINSIAAIGTDTIGNVYFVDLGGEIFALETLP